jgi:endonuclease/exonuclease/phosphatase family metal-dependent hydrolase
MRLKSGVAVLSRYPFEADSVPYSRAGFIGWLIGHNHYLDATFGLGGKRFRVIDAHLDSESEQRRESEALAIISGVREKALPAIVTGDLNAIMPAAKPSMRWRMFDNDTTMESFIDSGLFSIYMLGIDPADKSYLTGNTEELFKTVDYIVPTKDISIEEYYVVRAFGSDHLPVAAVVIV